MGSLADLGQVDCDLTLVKSDLDHWFDCLIAFIIHREELIERPLVSGANSHSRVSPSSQPTKAAFGGLLVAAIVVIQVIHSICR